MYAQIFPFLTTNTRFIFENYNEIVRRKITDRIKIALKINDNINKTGSLLEKMVYFKT